MKEFLYAYNTIYKIAAFVQPEYDFLVREGNTLDDSFITAVNRAKLQFKHKLVKILNDFFANKSLFCSLVRK